MYADAVALGVPYHDDDILLAMACFIFCLDLTNQTGVNDLALVGITCLPHISYVPPPYILSPGTPHPTPL